MLKIKFWQVYTVIVVVLLAVAACTAQAPEVDEAQPGSSDNLSGTLVLAGSTTVQPLAEMHANAFMTLHPEVVIDVQGGGSSVGVKSAANGTAEIGMASREVKESEFEETPGLEAIAIAMDGIAIVVHPDVAVEELTAEQVKGIFSGQIADWSEVGGADESIVVISREEGSGTRAAFEELALGEESPMAANAILQPSNGAVLSTLASTPNSIAYLSFGYLNDDTKVVRIDGVDATVENVISGTYAIARPLNFVIKGQPGELAQAFIDFVLSVDGQTIVTGEGYISVSK